MDFTKIEVKDALNKENISRFLRRHDISYRYLEKLKKEFGNIKLNGKIVTGDFKIKNGDIIEIKNNVQPKSNIQTCIIPLDIVYEDDYILIINKPSGLATMPTKSVYDYNLAGAIMFYMQDKNPDFVCRIINRLDKDVSGLVLVAKNSFTTSFFNSNASAVQKTYHAIATGYIDAPQKIEKKIATVINENGQNMRQRVVDEENGLSATTFVEPIKQLHSIECTLIMVKLISGRTHQIRLHLSSIGHPLLGDSIYGEPSPLLGHTALICKTFDITHPISKKLLHFEIEYSNDIKALLTRDEI